ncbi:WD40 repeat domain-containing protein [Streptacidiphilus sp. EB103A]|uniref:WD40 repeat domain-containing protein n=1 Tax=Streptacidiphilus sp. EB103A TaxID=3156275 RepID=UPI003518F7E6
MTTTTAETTWTTAVDDAPIAVATARDLVAVAGADGTAWILEATTGQPVGTVTLPGGLLAAAFSPDAAHLALAGPAGHALWRRADGRVLVEATGVWSSAVRWASAERVAVASGRRGLVLDTDGKQLWATESAPSTVTDLAWMRDGRRLATSAYGAVRCYERHQTNPAAEYRYLGSHLAIALAPTGKWICTGNQDASIHIWRTRDGSDLTMHGYPDKISRLAFDDTGFWLACDGAPDITVWDFSGKGPEGTRPRSLRAHETVTALAWRPGGARILASAGAEGTVALWKATSGRGGARLHPAQERELPDPVTALAWAGPGLLVLADYEGRVQAWPTPRAMAR